MQSLRWTFSSSPATIPSMRRTKIIATLGPASWDEPVLRELIAAGRGVARLHVSAGYRSPHALTLDPAPRPLRQEEKEFYPDAEAANNNAQVVRERPLTPGVV